MGVAKEQPHLTKLAKFYAEKHKKYKVLMGRVNTFIVAVRKAERRLRQERKKEGDPFGTKKGEEVKIEKVLKYAETENTISCKPREIREDEGGGSKEKR